MMPANHPLPPHEAARALRDLLLAILTEARGAPTGVPAAAARVECHAFPWYEERTLELTLDARDERPGVPHGLVQLREVCPCRHAHGAAFFRFTPAEGGGSYARYPSWQPDGAELAAFVVRALLLRAI